MAELKNELTWSRSRAGTFDDCARRYWFTYYGSWGGWKETSAPRIRQAYILKQLQSRWMWVGDIVHDQIAKVLRAAQMGKPMTEAEASEAAIVRMREDYKSSKGGDYKVRPKKAAGLIEHEYGDDVTDAGWREVADHMKACIGAYYKSPYPAEVAKLARGSWFPFEELSHFFLDGVKVWVKPDFAYRGADGRVEIVDWKTGRKDEDADPVQLACYSIFALEKGWAKVASEVTTTEYRLAFGKAVKTVMDDQKLDDVRVKIRKSMAAMREPLDDVATNKATEAKFPVAVDTHTCRTCNYRKICEDRPK